MVLLDGLGDRADRVKERRVTGEFVGVGYVHVGSGLPLLSRRPGVKGEFPKFVTLSLSLFALRFL